MMYLQTQYIYAIGQKAHLCDMKWQLAEAAEKDNAFQVRPCRHPPDRSSPAGQKLAWDVMQANQLK